MPLRSERLVTELEREITTVTRGSGTEGNFRGTTIVSLIDRLIQARIDEAYGCGTIDGDWFPEKV